MTNPDSPHACPQDHPLERRVVDGQPYAGGAQQFGALPGACRHMGGPVRRKVRFIGSQPIGGCPVRSHALRDDRWDRIRDLLGAVRGGVVSLPRRDLLCDGTS